MKCAVCGGELKSVTTDLPFKVSDSSIVVLKSLPVIQCSNCPEYLIEDDVLGRIDEILSNLKGGTELEVVRFAA